ncbi:hypothetical protein SAMN06295888_1552 [Desulfonatronum zhilinae]|nr:hypothetical protein SAMN06295888_1552 [Desulfonatronum zhilinae]
MLKDKYQVVGKSNVTLKCGMSEPEQIKYQAITEAYGQTVMILASLIASVGGDAIHAAFPANTAETRTGFWSFLPVISGVALQFVAMEGIMKDLIKTLNKAKSEINLSADGIAVKTHETAHKGIKMKAEPSSTIGIVPDDVNSIVLERAGGGIVIVERRGVILAKDGGAQIKVGYGNGLDSPGQVVLTRGTGEIIVDNGNVTAEADTGSAGRIALTTTSAKMEQGGKYVSIDGGAIKLKFGDETFELTTFGTAAKGKAIRLG